MKSQNVTPPLMANARTEINCRFKKGSLILDVLPTDKKILGFSNKWYKDGISEAQKINLVGYDIQVFTVPYLIASKIDAFKGRGKDKFRDSFDIEDIVTIIDGRAEITTDLNEAKQLVKQELKKEFSVLLKNERFIDSLDGHIFDRQNIEGRKKIVIGRIEEFLKE
jgi:hypothetical protein